MDFNQTKQLVQQMLKFSKWEQVAGYMRDKLGVKGNEAGVLIDALEKHSNVLSGMKPLDLEHVFAFISKQALSRSPLAKKLSPEQQQRLQVAHVESSLLSKILAADESELMKFQTTVQNWLNQHYKHDEMTVDETGDDEYPFIIRMGDMLADAKALEQFQDGLSELFWQMKQKKTYKSIIPNWWGDDADESQLKIGVGDELSEEEKSEYGYPMLSKVLAESSDRAAKPSNDVINEVQPLKWKKAKPGQSAPLNMPMNPDAKDPQEKMEGMPQDKPAVSMLAKVLATNEESVVEKLRGELMRFMKSRGQPSKPYEAMPNKDLLEKYQDEFMLSDEEMKRIMDGKPAQAMGSATETFPYSMVATESRVYEDPDDDLPKIFDTDEVIAQGHTFKEFYLMLRNYMKIHAMQVEYYDFDEHEIGIAAVGEVIECEINGPFTDAEIDKISKLRF